METLASSSVAPLISVLISNFWSVYMLHHQSFLQPWYQPQTPTQCPQKLCGMGRAQTCTGLSETSAL